VVWLEGLVVLETLVVLGVVVVLVEVTRMMVVLGVVEVMIRGAEGGGAAAWERIGHNGSARLGVRSGDQLSHRETSR
jgi:hypothetical protein